MGLGSVVIGHAFEQIEDDIGPILPQALEKHGGIASDTEPEPVPETEETPRPVLA